MNAASNLRTSSRANLRIIWAIASKDIVDALRNKNVLGNLISVLFIIVMYQYLPVLGKLSDAPRLYVYDAGNSSLVAALEESAAVELRTYPSQEEMKAALGHGDVPQLGLAIPADFDQRLKAGEPVELAGYVLHWVTATEASKVKAHAEGVIADLLGQPVSIYVDGNVVYAAPDAGGRSFLVSLLLVVTTSLMGVVIVPHLMIEERQAKTLDVLLVSPANIGQVVAGKALTGLFYCLITAAVVLGWNATLVVHWWLAILATACGALMMVALGLLFGCVFRVRQQMTLWGFLALNVLLVPTFLAIMEEILPQGLIAVLRWVPTVALTRVLRVSFSEAAPLGQFAPGLALVLGCAAAILAVVVWLVRRSDR